MEGVGSFLCEQRRGAEEELSARPQLQMEVGYDDSDIIQLFSRLHLKLRNQVMLCKSQHIGRVCLIGSHIAVIRRAFCDVFDLLPVSSSTFW